MWCFVSANRVANLKLRYWKFCQWHSKTVTKYVFVCSIVVLFLHHYNKMFLSCLLQYRQNMKAVTSVDVLILYLNCRLVVTYQHVGLICAKIKSFLFEIYMLRLIHTYRFVFCPKGAVKYFDRFISAIVRYIVFSFWKCTL